MNISVIICSHNPNKLYLNRVIQSLKKQSLSFDQWELLLIDNASDVALSENFDLSWHEFSKHIKEENLGLTSARIRGIRESKADLIIFVDDDNVLDSNYLQNTLNISKDWPVLGAWGGKIIPEFESQPSEWTKLYWNNLAIRDFEKDQWGNTPYLLDQLPCGAGLCLRRVVAEEYVQIVTQSTSQLLLDRKGKLLSSSGDTMIVLTACDMGYGTGMFTSLKLTHIIPSSRLEEKYLLRLEEGLHYSGTILRILRGESNQISWKRKIIDFIKFLLMSPRKRRFKMAAQRGIKRAKMSAVV